MITTMTSDNDDVWHQLVLLGVLNYEFEFCSGSHWLSISS